MPKGLLEEVLGEKLKTKRYTVATAESCTGGLIAHRITNVPGSSEYFSGGVVTYSNTAKMRLLGVRLESLETVGAVSEEVAREMASGARRLFGADVAVGVTGIAGPGGGTEGKPVGLVYVSVASARGAVVERNEFSGERTDVKSQTADRALQLLLEQLG